VLKWLGAPFHERAYDTEMDSASAAEDSWRVAMSALLDGEEPPVPVADLMQHLSECASCSAWLDNAMVVNQGMRSLPVHHRDLGEMVVNSADVALCACGAGGDCMCSDCQCGPGCTCQSAGPMTSSCGCH
jgi:hypothetical protein